jgi:hypothetical protein
MSTSSSLFALLSGLLLHAAAYGYEENSYATKPSLFFARVDESTDINFPSSKEAAKLRTTCNSGQLYRIESNPPVCRCVAKPLEDRHPEMVTVTLHCQATKGMQSSGALVLASSSMLEFDEFQLDKTQNPSSLSAHRILTFLKSMSPELRKRRNPNSLPIYFVQSDSRRYWVIHTATKTMKDAGCERRKFKLVREHAEAIELIGEVYDVDSIIRIKSEGRTLLRSSNQCDGVQADLYDLSPKISLSATFSGH